MELRGVNSDDATDALVDCADRNDVRVSDVATMVMATHDLHYAPVSSPDELLAHSVPEVLLA
jgi:hypothetical protein